MHAMQEEGRAPLTPADSHDAPAAVATAGRSRLYAVLAVTALLALVLDQGSKVWALDNLTPGQSRGLLGSGLRLELIRNPGAAFSIGTNVTWLLVAIGIVVLVWISLAVRRVGSMGWAFALGLLLGGSLGNLVDRFFRAPGPGRGQVVDFIDYGGLFIGNIADIAIVGAAVLIVILALRGVTISGDRVTNGRGRHTTEGGTGAAPQAGDQSHLSPGAGPHE